jgi:hypothetical protein
MMRNLPSSRVSRETTLTAPRSVLPSSWTVIEVVWIPWELVTDQLAAAAGEGWWATDQARQVLLVVVGRGTSAPALVWPDAASDLGAAGAERLARRLRLQSLGPRDEGR